jgi:hypothetical protein
MPSMMVLGVFEGFFAFHAATVEKASSSQLKS